MTKWKELKKFIEDSLNYLLQEQDKSKKGEKFMPEWEEEMTQNQIQILTLIKNRMINLEKNKKEK